jgi:O-antigen/teichoic acid export membrane protein
MSRSGWSLPAKVRRNIGFKLVGTVVEKGLRALLVFSAARLLGPASWGRYTYAFAIAMLMVQVTDLGLGLFLNRELARKGSADGALIGQVLTFKAALAGVYLLAIAAMAGWHLKAGGDDTTVPIAIVLCGGIALATTAIESLVQIFRGVQDLSLEARAHSVHAVIAVVCGGAVLGATVTLWGVEVPTPQRDVVMLWFAGAMLVSGVFGSGYAFVLVRRLAPVRWGLSRELRRRFRTEVLPLGIAIVASMIYYRIDVPMIRNLLPAASADMQTGLYTAAYKLLEHTALFPAILMAAAFPALSQTVATDPQHAAQLHKVTLRYLLLGGGTVCLGFALLAEPIVALLYGPQFADSAPILVALAPCVLLTFVNYLETHMLVALGLVKAQMAISIALIGVNVGLNWWWIPLWQGAGAAWATAATEVCLLLAVAPIVARGLRQRVRDGSPLAAAQ